MVFEVRFPLLGVDAADSGVADQEDALPLLKDIGKMVVLGVEDVVDELEA